MKGYFIRKRDWIRGAVSRQAKHRNLKGMWWMLTWERWHFITFSVSNVLFSNMNEMQFLTTSNLCALLKTVVTLSIIETSKGSIRKTQIKLLQQLQKGNITVYSLWLCLHDQHLSVFFPLLHDTESISFPHFDYIFRLWSGRLVNGLFRIISQDRF